MHPRIVTCVRPIATLLVLLSLGACAHTSQESRDLKDYLEQSPVLDLDLPGGVELGRGAFAGQEAVVNADNDDGPSAWRRYGYVGDPASTCVAIVSQLRDRWALVPGFPYEDEPFAGCGAESVSQPGLTRFAMTGTLDGVPVAVTGGVYGPEYRDHEGKPNDPLLQLFVKVEAPYPTPTDGSPEPDWSIPTVRGGGGAA